MIIAILILLLGFNCWAAEVGNTVILDNGEKGIVTYSENGIIHIDTNLYQIKRQWESDKLRRREIEALEKIRKLLEEIP